MELRTCSYCHFNTKYPFNLSRHLFRIHGCVDGVSDPKDIPTSTKDIPTILNIKQCEKCEKIFTKHSTKIKHQEKCRGKINPLQCIHCQEFFTCSSNKYRHQKKCKLKQEEKHHEILQSTTINNITNNNITNNIGTQNNNITVNIIKYDNLATIEFDDKHISDKDLKRIFRGATIETLQVMIKYANKLLQNPKNLCVRKKHITNSYCEVHKGDGKWEVQPDKQVFDKITQDISINANDRLYENGEIGTDKIRNDILELTNIPLEKEIVGLHNSLRCNLRSEVINKNDEKNDLEG